MQVVSTGHGRDLVHDEAPLMEEEMAIVRIQVAADMGLDTLQLNHLPNLREVPRAVKMLREQLQVLELDNNYTLRALPSLVGDLHRLRRLDARYCHIESIHHTISRLSRLEQLLLSNNYLGFLPPEVGQLRAMTELRVDNNELRVLPGGLVFLPNLKAITLENNPLYTPEQVAGATPVDLVPHLDSVDCAGCRVRTRNYRVTVSFHRLPSHPHAPLPFVFFLCSEECMEHHAHNLAKHDERMKPE